MNPLERAENFLLAGEEKRARDLVLKFYSLPAQTPEEYLRWGKLCEALALPGQAAECYQRALSQDSAYFPAIRALAFLRYELGDFDAAARLLRRVLAFDSSDEEARRALGQIYLSFGELGSYFCLFPEHKKPSFRLKGPRIFPKKFGSQELKAFEAFLYGRCGYAETILDEYGKPSLIFHEGALSYELLEQHLLGQRYLHFFPISEKLKVKTATFGVRYPLKALLKRGRDSYFLKSKAELTSYLASKCFRKLKALGLPGVLERLDPWSYRFWFVLKEPVHFLVVKRFLEALRERLPLPEGGVLYVPWNFTRPRGIDWEEVAVPLPLGIHPGSGERSILLNEKAETVLNPLLAFKKLRHLSLEEVKDFSRRGKFHWAFKRRQKLLEEILQKCPLLAYLVRKAEAGYKLTRQEKLAIFLTIGLLDSEGALLHEVLYPTPDYRYPRVERQRKSLPPNPISCYKLREWFPDLAAIYSCDCLFEDPLRYPSPLLHVAPTLVPSEKPLTLEFFTPKELARRYIHFFLEKERLKARMSEIEKELSPYLKARPGKRLETEGGYFLEFSEGKLQIRKK